MDQETVRQLVIAGTAIFAALGGAGVTGYINHKNTARMLASSKELADRQWIETRAVEQEQWTRDKKADAYATFLRVASPIVGGNFTKGMSGFGKTDELALDVASSAVLMFGSGRVILAAGEYRGKFNSMRSDIKALSDGLSEAHGSRGSRVSDEAVDRMKQAAADGTEKIVSEKGSDLMREYHALGDLMRIDCGVGETGQTYDYSERSD